MKVKRFMALFAAVAVLLAFGCAPKFGTVDRSVGWKQKGEASWYGKKFHGRTTASGEVYNMYKLTAAHRTLPFGTLVRVTNLKNHKAVVVRINDRGPWIKKRIIDLSFAAAQQVDMVNDGVVQVSIVVVEKP